VERCQTVDFILACFRTSAYTAVAMALNVADDAFLSDRIRQK